LLDWIQSRDRGNDKRVVGNREGTPRTPGPDRPGRADPMPL
jgi:hypothetical protein